MRERLEVSEYAARMFASSHPFPRLVAPHMRHPLDSEIKVHLIASLSHVASTLSFRRQLWSLFLSSPKLYSTIAHPPSGQGNQNPKVPVSRKFDERDLDERVASAHRIRTRDHPVAVRPRIRGVLASDEFLASLWEKKKLALGADTVTQLLRVCL